MPGIAGIIQKKQLTETAAILRRMLRCMTHESFYCSDSVSIAEVSGAFGWVCHKDSFTDCMPVWNETKDVCLIFNGEDFCDSADIEALKADGHQFDAGNASYLVHLYEKLGPEFVRELNGWFSGIVVDNRTREIHLFNDRYGLSRVYYHETPEAFYFSSEAKSLLEVLPGTRELDLQSLGEMFSCGSALGDRTLFRGVSLLPTASMWTFSGGIQSERAAYFRSEAWENQSPLDANQYHESLTGTFSRILPRYFRPNGRMGVSVTGGVDSRMIMAWSKSLPQSLPCYTFGGMYRESTDVRMGRDVATTCRQRHEVIKVDSEFLAEFPSLAQKTVYISDGTMDVSGAVELHVNRVARKIAPIRLSGSYGGEVLRGLVAFKPTNGFEHMLDRELTRFVRQAAETYAEEMKCPRLSFVAFKQVPWYHYSRLSIEQSQLTIRSPFLDNDLVSLAYRAPKSLAASKQLALQIIEEGNPLLSRIQTDRGLTGNSASPVAQMRHAWQEFAFKSEYAYDYGMPQWLVRVDQLLKPFHLERLFLGRHKFYHFRVWYRDSLAGYVREILLDKRTLNRPFLNRRAVEQIVAAHVKGTANYTTAIHKLLTCELMCRALIDRN